MVTEYLDFYIQHSPPAIPLRAMDWQYWHKDYDGPEDGRCGTAASEEDAKTLIREYWLEHSEFWIQEDFHDGWHIIKDMRGNCVHYANRHDDAEWWIIQKGLSTSDETT